MRQPAICFCSQVSHTAFWNLGYVSKALEIKNIIRMSTALVLVSCRQPPTTLPPPAKQLPPECV